MKSVKVEMFLPGELKNRPIICDMVRDFDINMKIVEASFTTESGWAVLILDAESDVLDKAFHFLEKQGVRLDVKK